jgi:hypothetical protein
VMARVKKKPGGHVAEELERLYLQAPERFTAERDALAKRLREDGDREAAQEVRKLRKPSLAAWLVNQLGLREPDDVEALLDAGERLRGAEQAMLAGKGDGDELRVAAVEERDAIERLVAAARRIAADDDRKLNQATLDRVAETLQAAGADEETAEKVRAGRLTRETRRASIGASTRAPSGGRSARVTKKQKAARAREEASAALDGARRDLERAHGVAERAQDDVDLHADRLKGAREALTRAKREAKRAESEVRRAEQRSKKP